MGASEPMMGRYHATITAFKKLRAREVEFTAQLVAANALGHDAAQDVAAKWLVGEIGMAMLNVDALRDGVQWVLSVAAKA